MLNIIDSFAETPHPTELVGGSSPPSPPRGEGTITGTATAAMSRPPDVLTQCVGRNSVAYCAAAWAVRVRRNTLRYSALRATSAVFASRALAPWGSGRVRGGTKLRQGTGLVPHAQHHRFVRRDPSPNRACWWVIAALSPKGRGHNNWHRDRGDVPASRCSDTMRRAQ